MALIGMDQWVHPRCRKGRIPDTPNPLNAQQMDELRELVNPLAPGDDLGISLYAITCMAVQSFIS